MLSCSNSSVNTAVKPPVPLSVWASGVGMNSIRVGWVRILGATSYTVLRSASDSGTFSFVKTVVPDSFVDTGLVAGNLYYYKVVASNNFGSDTSSPVYSTTAIPSDLAAIGTSSSGISVNWALIPGAASYNVYRSFSDTGAFAAVGTVSIDTFIDTGLKAGTIYYYKIGAANGSQESPLSASINAITVPAMPMGLAATAVSSVSIMVVWPPVAGAKSFKVYRSTTNDTGSYAAVGIVTADTIIDSGTADTSLSPSTLYYYKVTALDTSGESGQSAPASATTNRAAPLGVMVAGATSDSITVIWKSFPYDAPITSYKVYRSGSASGSYSIVATLSGAADTSFTDTGLSAGTQYYYKITAVGDSGESGPSVSVNATTVPAVPLNVVATGVSKTSIVVTWPVVQGATYYAIYRDTTDTGSSPLRIGPLTAGTFTDTGLDTGKTYYYRVSASNLWGESGMSALTSANTLLTGVLRPLSGDMMFALRDKERDTVQFLQGFSARCSFDVMNGAFMIRHTSINSVSPRTVYGTLRVT